jgi:hypothetical protein
MSERMEWEGGPVLIGLKHMIEERQQRENHLQDVLDCFRGKVPFPWEMDDVVQDMIKRMEVEKGIVGFSSWIV